MKNAKHEIFSINQLDNSIISIKINITLVLSYYLEHKNEMEILHFVLNMCSVLTDEFSATKNSNKLEMMLKMPEIQLGALFLLSCPFEYLGNQK